MSEGLSPNKNQAPLTGEQASNNAPGPPVSATGDDEVTQAIPVHGPRNEVPGYRVLREVSRGGQAVVFEAIQISTTRKVAIKIMREGPWASARNRARFDREVQILAALSHPNIVQVLDRGTTADGSMFLAMPYIDGRPLDQWLAAYYEKNPQGATHEDPAELLRLFMKICDAVNAAHLRGVVHRDLKPSNIRIDEHDEAHILDFGLARTAVSEPTDEDSPQIVTLTGQFMGSLPWASPEQAQGTQANVDARSDVYSLGVILYQMITDQFPYEVAGNMRDVLNNIITAEPAPPSHILGGRLADDARNKHKPLKTKPNLLNPVIDAIVLKTLSKRREDRYQSAGELARDLANYLSGRPTLAAGVPPHSAWPRWGTAAASLGGLVVACFLIGLGWSLNNKHGLESAPGVAPTIAPTLPDPQPNAARASTRDAAAMRALGSRVASGDRAAFDELDRTAVELYRGIDFEKDDARLVQNKALLDAAFEVLGKETAAGSTTAFDAIKRALNTPSLNSFVPDALGIAAGNGHAESLDMLVHPQTWSIGDVAAVWAVQSAAHANREAAVDYLVAVLGKPDLQPLWYEAAQGLMPAADKGNVKAKAALAQYRDSQKPPAER